MDNPVEMTVKVPAKVDEKLERRKNQTGMDKANQIRDALDRYCREVIE